MYEITVKNYVTNIDWKEKGLSRYIAKRINFLMNEKFEDGTSKYEIIKIEKIKFSIKMWRKCFWNETKAI